MTFHKAPPMWGYPRSTLPYDEYLQSEEWALRRYHIRWLARDRCRLCGSMRKPQHVHHLTYDRLGNEDLRDLVLLCWRCHERVHGIGGP